MVAWNWGLNVAASSTVDSSPAPTTTTCRLTTITNFHEETRIQIKVGGFFEKTFITNITGNDITFSPPLSAPPDTGVGSLCEDRSEIIVWEKLQSMTDAINDNAALVDTKILALAENVIDLDNNLFPQFGNGQDGPFYLGPITDPTISQTPTIALDGAGYINGSVSVAVEAYNFSGQTLVTAQSNTVVAANNKLSVFIPAWASTNITGFNVYLKIGAGPNFRVLKVTRDYNMQLTGGMPYQGLTITLNTPMTSGTAPSGVNNTSHNATLSGTFRVHGGSFGTSVAQIITVQKPGLIILSDTNLEMGSFGQIVGNGIGGLKNGEWRNAANTSFYTYGQTVAGGGGGSPIWGSGFPGTVAEYLFQNNPGWDWLYSQGGINSASVNQAGGTVILGARNILFAQGQINCNGTAGTTAGCAGGFIGLIGRTISRGGAVLNANGGAAVGTRAGGGGGGIIAFIYENLFGTSTNNVNGGAGGAAGVGTQAGGGGFGGFGGNAGPIGVNPGVAGTAGQILQKLITQVNLPTF